MLRPHKARSGMRPSNKTVGDCFLNRVLKKRKTLLALLLAVLLAVSAGVYGHSPHTGNAVPVQAEAAASSAAQEKKDFIKWVDFNVTYLAMQKAMKIDIDSHNSGGNISWIDLLAYLGAKYGGDFSRYKSNDMDTLVGKLQSQSMESLTDGMKYFTYYKEAYTAALGGLVGKFKGNGKEQYGLIGFSPIAKSFPYSDFDDFGTKRTYGYARPHLGHDMMAATGTPVIAVESGVVEALGWNQYGGWRIGVRSFDSKRYYYYAHLRQNRPYAQGLAVGQTVTAGDVIGYVGHTGYSTTENVNNINVSHLHFGLELIFDESQKESVNEIWIDLYQITKLLRQHQMEVVRDSETKEYTAKDKIEVGSETPVKTSG